MSNDEEFARTRSHQDAKVATELARAAAWAAILLNGGACGAVLTVGPPMAAVASYALGGYALGAFFAALMLFVLFQWIERWNIHWEAVARGQSKQAIDQSRRRAARLTPAATICFALSMLGFLIASAALVRGMMTLAGPPS
jgi:hypothetical protein